MATKKGTYVDGFVLVIPKKKLDAYKQVARVAGKVWRKYGALDYKECVIEDAKPKGIVMTFGKMTKAKPSEAVIFSYIVYPSRAQRDSINAKVMKDPFMDDPKNKEIMMSFDMTRMAVAGFSVIVDAK